MTKDDIPNSWRTLLADLQGTCAVAILAGGALRDLWCGKEPKDLDFFIGGWRERPSGWLNDIRDIDSNFDYDGMKYVQGVQSFSGGPLPINIIHCDPWPSVEDFLKSFDFGINQIAFDATAVITTPEFLWDFKYGLFTLYHSDRYYRSMQRFERINVRYGWKLALANGVAMPVSNKASAL